MRNIGQHRTEPHHVAGPGYFQDHGLAFARCGGNLDLAEADDEDVPRRVAFGKQLGPARMAHHDADSVVILECLGCEIAEHPQMAVLAIQAIFRWVMGMDRSHSWTEVSVRSIAHIQ
jgi:hypothetical protein